MDQPIQPIHRVVFTASKTNKLCILEADGEQVAGMFEDALHCENRKPNSVTFIESKNRKFARCGHPDCCKEYENFCPVVQKWSRKEVE